MRLPASTHQRLQSIMVTGVRLFTRLLSSSTSVAARPRPTGGGGWSRLGCAASGTEYRVYPAAPASRIHRVLPRYSLLPIPTRFPPFQAIVSATFAVILAGCLGGNFASRT